MKRKLTTKGFTYGCKNIAFQVVAGNIIALFDQKDGIVCERTFLDGFQPVSPTPIDKKNGLK